MNYINSKSRQQAITAYQKAAFSVRTALKAIDNEQENAKTLESEALLAISNAENQVELTAEFHRPSDEKENQMYLQDKVAALLLRLDLKANGSLWLDAEADIDS